MSQIIKSISSTPKWLISSILVCLFYIAVLPYNEATIFVLPYENHQALHVASLLKLLFLPILFSLFYFILTFLQRIIDKDPYYRLWLKTTLIYGCVMLAFFLLLYPGHWVGDEFNILEAVRHYSLYSWQNYLTNIFYTFSLYLIPSGVGIVIIQLGILSIITGYVVAFSKKIFQGKYTHYFLFIPFLSFPVILNNFYPLRLTVFSYLLLLLIAQLIFLYRKLLSPKHPRLFFLQVSFITAIVCFWRSEGLIYLSLLPLFAHSLGLLRKPSFRQPSTYITFASSLCVIGLIFGITAATTSDKYQITATLNPLSTMIQGRLSGNNINQDLKAINEVVDLSVVKHYPSYDEIPSFWNGAVRNDYSLHLKDYNSHVYNIFLNNPNAFISNRIQVFLHTNSFNTYPSLGLSQFYNSDPTIIQKVQDFYNTNKFSRPLNLHVKLATTKRLLLVDSQYHPGILAKLVWSIIPTILALIIILVISIVKKKWLYGFITTLLLLHTAIIFMTAPASYFMYYLPTYLTGNFLLAIFILRACELRLPSIYRRLDNYLEKNLQKNRRFIFLLIGAVNTLLDFIFYTFLADVIFRSPNQIALVGIVSGTFALACAYMTHRLITWRDKHTTKLTMVKFFTVTGFGLWVIRPLLLSWFITFTPLYSFTYSITKMLGLPFTNHFIASTGAFLIMVIIVMIYNYFTYARFVFSENHNTTQ